MDCKLVCNHPDLEAFESNLCAMNLVRELGETAALVSDLCPNESDPQLVEQDNAQ